MKRAPVMTGILLLLAASFPGAAPAPPTAPVPPAVQPGEQEMKALQDAWPDRISEVALRDGDWMLRMDNVWFAWAHGRLLPEAEASQWESFSAMPFYTYPLELPPLPQLSPEAVARLRARVHENERHPPRRSEEFLGELLHASNRAATEVMLVRTQVAGFSVTVHERLQAPLARISRKLMELRSTDPQVKAFLAGIQELNGYSYRDVAGTATRSLHSFGLALDFIPKTYRGKEAYWMWAMNRTPDWWAIPYDRRWMMPMPIVQAFEQEGFIWGGKWLFFDTMHFEYRPELFFLARERAAPAAPAAPPGDDGGGGGGEKSTGYGGGEKSTGYGGGEKSTGYGGGVASPPVTH